MLFYLFKIAQGTCLRPITGGNSVVMEATPDYQGAARNPGRSAAAAFTRPELDRILRLYGQFVAAGIWRDYAIDLHKDAAIFSIFRRSAEMPLYRIEKRPRLAGRQGMWMVVSMSGAVLKRGHELEQVLKIFDRQRLRLVAE